MNCKGNCKKHGKPCLASVDPKVLDRTRKAAGVLGVGVPKVRNGVMQHTHRCEDCLAEVHDKPLSVILGKKK
jgi:hypothetical protein